MQIRGAIFDGSDAFRVSNGPRSEPALDALLMSPADRVRLLATGLSLFTGPVRFETPIGRPGKIIGAPVNYRSHVEEMIAGNPGSAQKEMAVDRAGLFLKASSSLAPADAPLRLRFPARRTDHEVELVAVIGRAGNRIRREDALDHVIAYAVGLDITLRGPEDRSYRKSLDGYTVVGPWLHSADEVGDPHDIELRLAVNGELRQQGSTRDLIFGVDRLIEYASSFFTLEPGDLLFTGTPAGVGSLKPGDVIEAEGSRIGSLRVQVADEDPST